MRVTVRLMARCKDSRLPTCSALRVLHGCGWVHRDISTGNILLFKDSVKLADLEFAARMDSIHDHKRGRIVCLWRSFEFIPLTNLAGNALFYGV